ncbi:putative RNA methyltransferase [Actinokineospora sp. UTMC 2448]|uniref:putative RNA methyltransferase n=1 Tax=Actinokineospora sp. UTMC 2448 TaxID=2268449 RepID=UPI002164E857|nr:23S rRNA methyltransferase [Actinokineospora sp. UTMC 2448]UVS76931.1 23S rRNA (guanine(748)-N(1))-methyltransferase [Actinokineospora sp. UTMC 2448]
MLADVLPFLVCPHCGEGLAADVGVLRCPRRHSFDVAKQGYVTLLRGAPAAGDTAEMVAARAGFLAAGHYDPLVRALADWRAPGLVVDAGAGTGFYLSALLDDGPGIALDSSKPALRRAARAHPRIGAVACDLWQPLPVRTAAASLVLNVFAPRNPPELRRVLRDGGTLLVAAPTSGHLAELVSELDLLTVDEDKQDRIDARLAPFFTVRDQRLCEFTLTLDRDDVRALIGMGPNAFHARQDRDERIAAMPTPVQVTASVVVTAYRAC